MSFFVCQGFAVDEHVYFNVLGWCAQNGGAATRWGGVVFADVCFFYTSAIGEVLRIDGFIRESYDVFENVC